MNCPECNRQYHKFEVKSKGGESRMCGTKGCRRYIFVQNKRLSETRYSDSEDFDVFCVLRDNYLKKREEIKQ